MSLKAGVQGKPGPGPDGRSAGTAPDEAGILPFAADPAMLARLFGSGPALLFKRHAADGWPLASVSGDLGLSSPGSDLLRPGRRYADLLHPDDAARVRAAVARAESDGAGELSQKYRILVPQGPVEACAQGSGTATARQRAVWLHERMVIERDAAGLPTAHVGYLLDVSTQHTAEAEAAALEQVRGVLQKHLNGVAVEYLGPDLRVRWASNTLFRNSGHGLEAVLGRTCHEVLKGRGTPCPGCTAIRALRSGEHAEGESVTPDGRSWWLSSTPVRDPSGVIDGVVHVATDITGRLRMERNLRKSEERFRFLVENMPVLIHAHDREGRYIFWNREAERVTGWDADRIIGNPDAARLLYPDDAYRVEAMEHIHEQREYRHHELETVCADGSRRIIAWTNVSRTLPVPGWASWEIGVDVTEHHRLEEYRADVERIMRHDLKKPLVQAVEMARLLRETGDEDELQSSLLSELEGSAQRSLRMLDAYVRLQAVEDGGLDGGNTASVCLDDLAEAVLAQTAFTASKTNGCVCWTWEVDELRRQRITGDFSLLTAMLANLVGNALEASPSGAPVQVACSAANGQAMLRIWNDAPIPEAVRDRFFEKFATYGKSDGLGLGTFAARFIARAHGGDITAETAEDAGTTLTVTLPLAD